MIEANNPILARMLDRLFASMLNGPSMNCRPHASRQRLDLLQINKLGDLAPGDVLLQMLGKEGAVKLAARVPVPTRKSPNEEKTPEQLAAQEAWDDQQFIRTKLRVIAEDARTYEQDTGVCALNLGFPLLSLPPGTFGGRFGMPPSRRVLAPIVFIPMTLTVKTGAQQAVEMARREGADIIIPNQALLAWLEKETGKSLADIMQAERTDDVWKDITDLVRAVAELIDMPVPDVMNIERFPTTFELEPTPKTDEDTLPSILPASVLGLYPASNQGLLRDVREMLAGGAPDGPIASFVRLGVNLDGKANVTAGQAVPAEQFGGSNVAKTTSPDDGAKRIFAEEKMITDADPCQAKAVRLAREYRGLVIHGPPGTGKSQTITNIIADHLGRGQRVLFVCDKRTALDVVADRLQTLGLGDLCAIVHDPQRDQRDLYRSVREQLDSLVDAQTRPRSADELAKIDSDLQQLHADLSEYHRLLMHNNGGGVGSFHHLVGLWLQENGCPDVLLDERTLADSSASDLRTQGTRLKEVLERGETANYLANPWKNAAGIPLADFLATPMEQFRNALAACVKYATDADAARDPNAPGYAAGAFPAAEADERVKLAQQLKSVLEQVPAADRARWAARPANLIQNARERLVQAADWINALKTTPIDNAITASNGATADQIGREREMLSRYLKAFNQIAGDFARVQRAAGEEADEATILRWLEGGTKAATSALKRLEGSESLATEIEQSMLEPMFVRAIGNTKIDAIKSNEWNAALDQYLEACGKMFSFGKKSAGEAVCKQFGQTPSAQSAQAIKDFLRSLQVRLDLQGVIEGITGENFPRNATDDQLIGEFKKNRAVLTALCKPTGGNGKGQIGEVVIADEHVTAINSLVAASASAATKVLNSYGFETSPSDAKRLESALRRLEAKARLSDVYKQVLAEPGQMAPSSDDQLIALVETSATLLELLMTIQASANKASCTDAVLKALREPTSAGTIIKALSEAPKRALALVKLEETLAGTFLFDHKWLNEFGANVREGGEALATMQELASRLDSLEGVLRVRDGLNLLPSPLAAAAATLLDVGANAEQGYSAIRRAVLAGEITRLRSEPNLQAVDGHRLKNTFDRYLELSHRKKQLVREVILSKWTQRQKDRLLIQAGTRLNAIGADLRRRLTGRGDKAMRLRQVINHGASVEGGDPFFELRPIWMASPETVAQLFPRQAIFDLIVFDEASQCRLEEALPVLTRAKRVVIAGDPKQLPPTRFFETSVATSGEEDEVDSDQELFEAHQGEIEDVLGAALGLDIHQCYLDVHYRSRHADLIGFSNEQFYGSRLQAIPEHPHNRSRHAPIALHRVEGIYDKRKNEAEADKVIKVVRELFKREQPPSIGIACFNLPQRDLIVEKLEEAAEQDAEFAAKLADARMRRGADSSEGLFVKNLENVQGDERDHLIISTTYGPTKNGTFRRNFGPVGKPGGGRRLNVLITRAREQLHIITSIPRSEYATLAPIPQGSSPSGTWLLFAYLNHCERLEEDYQTAWRILKNAHADENASVNPRPSRLPSQFAKSLAGRLVSLHNVGSDVHWGNDGFCVDLALHHPERAEDVSIGVLADMTRFATDDPVEWEVFRTHMLQHQGWKVHRIWTPHFFRDPNGCLAGVLKDIDDAMTAEKEAASKAAELNAVAAAQQQQSTGSSVRDIIKRRGKQAGSAVQQHHQPKEDKDAA